MKSQERHELERNDLATSLTDLPGLWRRHGNKVLLVVAVAFLVVAAVRYKRNQAAAREEQSRVSLANAWSGVQQLERIARGPASPGLATIRDSLEAQVNQAVQAVTDDTSATPTQSAWAWLARGEMYWALAHAPAADSASPAPAPTSAPASQPAAKTPADYRTLASSAYGNVVNNFADVSVPATIARYSLAAIAEEEHRTDDARKQYKAIIETKNFTSPPPGATADVVSMAEARLAKLDNIDKPLLLLPATQPAPTKSADTLLPPGLTGPMLPPSLSGPAVPPTLGTPSPTTKPAATQP